MIRHIAFGLLVAMTVWLCKASPEIKGGGEPGVVMELPELVDQFLGIKGKPEPNEIEVLPSDTQFAKMTYHSMGTRPEQTDVVNVSVVLSGADRRSIHRPEICLTAQGWMILNSRVIPVKMEDGRILRVRDLYISKPVTLTDHAESRDLYAHYIYWFAGSNATTPNHEERTWITLRDNVIYGINHRWAYASVMGLVTENFTPQEIGQRNRSDERTTAMLIEFIRDLVPRFQKEFMPHP